MFEPDIKNLTEEEKEEARRQQGMLGAKQSKKLYCSAKVAAGYRTFFHGRGHIGKIGIEKDGRHYIQIFAMNPEIKCILAGMTSDKGVHLFLNDCYDYSVELYKKSIEAAAKAVQTDADYIKLREEALKNVEQNLSEMRADQAILQSSQKSKKPQPVFNKDDFQTWQGLSSEDAGRSKNNLVETKTGLLKKINDIEKQNAKFTSEQEAFQKEVAALKVKLEAASDEKQYKEIRLSFDYNQLQVEKLKKKIEKNNEEKANIQTQLDAIDKQVEILNCVLDSHQLTKDAENWQNRNERAVERVSKVIKDRESLDIMRTNLNSRWQKLTSDPEPEKKRISIFSQDKPVKPEELCEALCLKASGKIYFL